MFEQFEKQSAESWRKKIEADLKGASFDTLNWKTKEGFTLAPFYTKENRPNDSISHKKTGQWSIIEHIKISDEDKNNKTFLEVLACGVDALELDFSSKSEVNFDLLFKDVRLNCITLIMHIDCHQLDLLASFLDYAKANYDLNTLNFSLSYDVFHSYYKSGEIDPKLDTFLNQLKSIAEAHSFETFRFGAIDLRYLELAGATCSQQLAYALSIAQYFVKHWGSKLVFQSMSCFSSTSSNFFFELAKLKTLRALWAFYAEQYGETSKLWISASTSQRNKTLYDPYVNVLRTCSETFSAILAGADAVHTQAFDHIYKESNAFSSRIARNQQLLLKGESYIEHFADPSAGSYYVEHLVEVLEKESYSKFQMIDSFGFEEYLSSGTLKTELENQQNQDLEDVEQNKIELLGSNLYPNQEEQMKTELEHELHPYQDYFLSTKRLSAHYENQRLAKES
ncbi:MAG: methylmalonyl-CoA mutase family protein [Flavobacteriales bacterium]